MSNLLSKDQHTDTPYFTPALFTICGLILVVFCLVSFAMGQTTFIYSALMGSFFSYFGFRQLVRSQSFMLRSGKRYVVFVSFVFRLILYAVPFIFALRYKDYFNLAIILVFLFNFQLSFIISELTTNLKQYKKRMTDG